MAISPAVLLLYARSAAGRAFSRLKGVPSSPLWRDRRGRHGAALGDGRGEGEGEGGGSGLRRFSSSGFWQAATMITSCEKFSGTTTKRVIAWQVLRQGPASPHRVKNSGLAGRKAARGGKERARLTLPSFVRAVSPSCCGAAPSASGRARTRPPSPWR